MTGVAPASSATKSLMTDGDCQWLTPCPCPCSARAHPDDPYEVTRAQELNQLLGPKASGQAFDFVLDLHNTTANVGACFILDAAHNVFALHMCHHLQVALCPQSAERGVGVVPLGACRWDWPAAGPPGPLHPLSPLPKC